MVLPGLTAPFKDEMGIGCCGKGTSRGRLFGILTVGIEEEGTGGNGCKVGSGVAGAIFEEDNTRHNRFKHAFLSLPGPP